jgi:hypothetical protein
LLSALIKDEEKEEEKKLAEQKRMQEIEEQKRSFERAVQEQKREQKLREEAQIREKEDREKERKERYHQPPSLEELIQSLAQTHAEQLAKENTHKQAQTLTQKIIQTLYQDGMKKSDGDSDENSYAELKKILLIILDQNSQLQTQMEDMKESIDIIHVVLEILHETTVRLEERIDDIIEDFESTK